eukprot:5739304-Ditylum_brightwellii.AAC.1
MQAGGTGQVSRHQTSGYWQSIPMAVGKVGPAEGRRPGQDSVQEPAAGGRAGGKNQQGGSRGKETERRETERERMERGGG